MVGWGGGVKWEEREVPGTEPQSTQPSLSAFPSGAYSQCGTGRDASRLRLESGDLRPETVPEPTVNILDDSSSSVLEEKPCGETDSGGLGAMQGDNGEIYTSLENKKKKIEYD